jgi:hypothetical protein
MHLVTLSPTPATRIPQPPRTPSAMFPVPHIIWHHILSRFNKSVLWVWWPSNNWFPCQLSFFTFLTPCLPCNSDFSHRVNFAVAGSTAIEYEFYAKHNISIDIVPVSIVIELGWYDKLLREKRGADGMEKTLFRVGELWVQTIMRIALYHRLWHRIKSELLQWTMSTILLWFCSPFVCLYS